MLGFGKRKAQEPATARTAGVQSSRAETPAGVGNLKTVIVRRSALERATDPKSAYDLVRDVINFLNAMTQNGLYTRWEIPAKAMQAYHADYYLAQVNNGGHSQFIGNSAGNLGYIIADVRAGLTGMKAEAHLAIFEQMAAWVTQNADEAAKQTGFQGGRAPFLEPLDKRFYEADRAAPMIGQSARWIASWPELKAVDDADYAEGLRLTAMMNPLREQRLMSRSVANLRMQMTEWFHAGIGLACATMSPREFKLAMGGGVVMDVEGAQQTVFHVRTNEHTRFCVVTKDHAAAYERVEPNNPPMPAIGDAEGMREAIRDGRLARYQSPTVGKRLSHVSSKMIAGVIELANEYRAPVALDLLLRKAGIDPNGTVISPVGIDPNTKGAIVNWFLFANNQPLFALSGSTGSILVHAAQNRELGRVSTAEIAEHAARVESVAVA